MSQPLTVPLFLPRESSDHSQPRGWRTATAPGSDRRRRSSGLLGAVRTALHAPGRPSRAVEPETEPEAPGPTSARRWPSFPTTPEVRRDRSRAVWAVAITGMALFMASLDNLVVSTALP